MSDLSYWVAATHLENIGPVRIQRWLKHFKNIEHLLKASSSELQAAGLTEKQIATIKNIHWQQVETDIKWYEQNDCHIITMNDPRYPILLREVTDAPLLLYCRGHIELLSQTQLAIVGSRHPTKMGSETAERFAYSLAQAGLIITSGMALGIDATSHHGALKATGKTIAVMGTGLQRVYPSSHRKLAEQIISTGLLVSEFPPSMEAHAQNFPMRNRIISGMSVGVLVIEAAIKSGSLITTRFAMEQNREVFAIPGSIHNPLARGCHQLIKQGAKLIESVEDILEEIGILHALVKENSEIKETVTAEQSILKCVGFEATSFDTICQRSKMSFDEVSSQLIILELEGMIHLQAGGYVRK